MYFDEDLILEIRLNTLNQVVDKFVICEATRDHGGIKKDLKFDIDKFSNFKEKIEYIIVEDIPLNVKSKKKKLAWKSYQRSVSKKCDSTRFEKL